MPSTKKTLHYLSSALLTSVSVGLLGFAISTQWASSSMSCALGGSEHFNGSAVIDLALFRGLLVKDYCPLFGSRDDFEVIPTLIDIGAAPGALHIVVVVLLVLCLLFSAISILISLYNSVSNPYQTYMGPVGVYTCNSVSVCLSVLILIIFAINIHVTGMAEGLVRSFAGSVAVDLKDWSYEMKVGYFMVIPYIVLNLGGIALIYMYTHAAYTRRKEQQRPTEDAPKEIMMY